MNAPLRRMFASVLLTVATLPAQAAEPRYVSPIPSTEPTSRVTHVDLYRGNAAVSQIKVEVAEDGLPADGQSSTAVHVRLLDRDGKLLQTPALLTVEVSAGRLLLPGAATDEWGSRPLDADRVTRGSQIKVENGEASFELLAPTDPQDVKVRVTAGDVWATGEVSFVPELREMVAAGLVEGVVRLSRKDPTLLTPVRVDDGFEDQLKEWSRSFSNGKGSAAGRAAMFLKGKIRGDTLLTLAYDSEKETRARLLRDIRPEEFYPVYGDASIKGFDAKSAEKLYVRVDKNKSYLLYGDYATGDGFSQLAAGGAEADLQLRRLGAYNRTLTGARGHWEQRNGFVNVFGSYDSLKQVVEEYRADGTSGPFAVRNSSGIENSEKVELLVRDRNQLNSIVRITALQRFSDYSFEPFSGRILFRAPIPSLDENGNPISIRVTYEVDQGGESFWLSGLDTQLNLGESTTLGDNFVDDRNPTSPYKLASLNFGTRFDARTQFLAEYARTENRNYLLGGSAFTNPTGQAGETVADQTGNAWRAELRYDGNDSAAKVWFVRAGAGFDNPNSGLTDSRREAGVRAQSQLSERWRLEMEALRVDALDVGAQRDGATLATRYKLNERVALLAGLRYAREEGDVGGQTFIAANLFITRATSHWQQPGSFVGLAHSGTKPCLGLSTK